MTNRIIIRQPGGRVQLNPQAAAAAAVAPTPVTGGGMYFSSQRENYDYIPTGCTLLDLALGGGWATGLIGNIAGNNSTGKTGLVIETFANLFRTFPNGRAWYREGEGSAFDHDYAKALGVPFDRVNYSQEIRTVEALAADLESVLAVNDSSPGFYAVDTLDGLSSEAELAREFTDASYGGEKAKKMSELFRRLAQPLKDRNVHLCFVSQVRDRMNAVGFGPKQSISGGKALEFYRGQFVWLTHMKKLTRQINKLERVYGIRINAEVRKTKVGTPWREADYDVVFGYGIDDKGCCEEFLKKLGKPTAYASMADMQAAVRAEWYAIEQKMLPPAAKYT